MQYPLISVIVPIYKVEKYLNKCVDSILRQTYSNLEVILVDDGSPDNCGRICDAYQAADERVKVIHKPNGGLGPARNSGLEICRGEYIAFVDSDDYLPDHALQTLYERLVADGCRIVMGKHTDAYEDGTFNDNYCRWMKNSRYSQSTFMGKMDGSCNIPVSVWGKLFQRRLFDDIRFPNLRCGEDLWAFVQVAASCDTISIVDQTVYFYRQRRSSIMHAKSEPVKQDELEATLFAGSFFLQEGYPNSARYWFLRGVDKALELEDRAAGQELFRQHFDTQQTKLLLSDVGMKERLKWAALQSCTVNSAYCLAKRMLKRG